MATARCTISPSSISTLSSTITSALPRAILATSDILTIGRGKSFQVKTWIKFMNRKLMCSTWRQKRCTTTITTLLISGGSHWPTTSCSTCWLNSFCLSFMRFTFMSTFSRTSRWSRQESLTRWELPNKQAIRFTSTNDWALTVEKRSPSGSDWVARSMMILFTHLRLTSRWLDSSAWQSPRSCTSPAQSPQSKACYMQSRVSSQPSSTTSTATIVATTSTTMAFAQARKLSLPS